MLPPGSIYGMSGSRKTSCDGLANKKYTDDDGRTKNKRKPNN